MKTFTEIENLLDELDNVNKGQNIMLKNGMVDRTEAGTRFFMSQMRRSNSIYEQLSEYPYQWVQAVETIKKLRNEPR